MKRFVLQFAAVIGLVALPAVAGSITTTFAGGNRFTGNMFNATIGTKALTVNSLAVNIDAGAATIDVYIKTGSYVSFETNPAAWTAVSATLVTGLGAGSQTIVNVTPFSLSAGTSYGIYVTVDNNVNSAPYMYYTTGANAYSNADLSLSLGEGLGGKFGSLSLTPGRTWNGTINYTLAGSAVPEPASFGLVALLLPGAFLLRRKLLA